MRNLKLIVGTAILAGLARSAPAPVSMPLDKRGIAFDYNNQKVRGVNLGGWFVLEPWITPSLFNLGDDVVDEYTFSAKLGKDQAYNTLSQHWNSWITQGDFNAIAAAGLNHVRIPIGYWAVAPLDGDPYVQGQLDVLKQAVGWASAAGLKVMVDLHGAPGSQNGFDNSGKYGPIEWQSGSNVDQTVKALSILADTFKGNTNTVTSIQLLNEPLGSELSLDGVKDFYDKGYKAVTAASQDYAVCIHDAFQDPQQYWNGQFTPSSGYQNVILDTHQYQVFDTNLVSDTPDQHVQAACDLGSKLASTDKWTIVGEWTGAQTDCAKWLNGYGKGARYDGSYMNHPYVGSCDGKYTGTVAGLSSDDKKNLQSFIAAQLAAYEKHTGWFVWTWKTESAPEWHMQDLIANGLFPSPISNYGSPCG